MPRINLHIFFIGVILVLFAFSFLFENKPFFTKKLKSPSVLLLPVLPLYYKKKALFKAPFFSTDIEI